jgi:hypothetical protein
VPVSSVDVIGPAFQRMKRQLFGPFRFGQWVRFAVVGFLAGEMGSSGGCGTRLPFDLPSQRSDQFQAPFPGAGPLAVLSIGLLIVLAFALAILLLYISSRMRFVLFDGVVAGECRIRESWSRRGTPAFRYFVWQILIILAAIVSLCVLIGLPLLAAAGLGLFQNPRDHVLAFVFGGLALLLLLVAWIVVFATVNVVAKDFVVPQMALENITAGEGWSRWWRMMKTEKGPYAGYLGMKLLLAIAAGVIFGIVTLIVIVVILVPVGGIGALTVLAGRAAGLTWNPVTIAIAIVIGSLILLAMFFIGSLISVPKIVFFPAYALYFFADRYPPLRALLFPPPEAPPEVSIPSPQP